MGMNYQLRPQLGNHIVEVTFIIVYVVEVVVAVVIVEVVLGFLKTRYSI